MALHKNRNFSFQDPECESGDVFERCNISQVIPETEICKDKTGLVFTSCNLVNCKPPADSKVESCNTAQISRCSHEHPEWVERGLPVCKADCAHREGTEKQWVEVDEAEYREQFASLRPTKPTKPAVRIDKTVDAANVTQQKFEKEVFVYYDTCVGKWRPGEAQ